MHTQFLTRAKVLKFYRDYIRNTRGLGDLDTRLESIAWLRAEIESNKHLTDPVSLARRTCQAPLTVPAGANSILSV